jgi:hypothetical protein
LSLIRLGRLVEVLFVHDYFQLITDEANVSVFGPSSLREGASSLRCGDTDFPYAMRRLIGQSCFAVGSTHVSTLNLRFDNGAELIVTEADDAPESFVVHLSDGRIIVGRE